MLNDNDYEFYHSCQNLPSTTAAPEVEAGVEVVTSALMPTVDSKQESRLRMDSRALWSGASSLEVMLLKPTRWFFNNSVRMRRTNARLIRAVDHGSIHGHTNYVLNAV